MVQTDSRAARPPGAAADVQSAAAAEAARSRRFQELALPHLDAAYNLARWLCGNPNDADDVVQEAFMRAFRFFDTFRGDSARPWLLAIVRRTWYSEWRRRASSHDTVEFDESMDDATFDGWSAGGDDPQTLLIRDEDTKRVHEALALLPVEYREVLILRELEEMGYREIALVADVPIGTVMSRLARGRKRLAALLTDKQDSRDSRGGGGRAGSGSRGSAGKGPPVDDSGVEGGAAFRARPNDAPRSADARASGHSGCGTDLSKASGAAKASVTPLRAAAHARSINPAGGSPAGFAQESPDGL